MSLYHANECVCACCCLCRPLSNPNALRRRHCEAFRFELFCPLMINSTCVSLSEYAYSSCAAQYLARPIVGLNGIPHWNRTNRHSPYIFVSCQCERRIHRFVLLVLMRHCTIVAASMPLTAMTNFVRVQCALHIQSLEWMLLRSILTDLDNFVVHFVFFE